MAVTERNLAERPALSNFSDAPYLGEAALIFNFTRRPVLEPTQVKNYKIPIIVYLIIAVSILFGVGPIIFAVITARSFLKKWPQLIIPAATVQFSIWILLIISGISILIMAINTFIGIFLILVAQLLPIRKRLR